MVQKQKSIPVTSGISPVGEIKFCHLDVPDTRFSAEGRYSITLLLNPEDPKVQEWSKAIEEAAAGKKLVFKHDAESNFLEIQFHSKDKPKLFDSLAQPIPPEVVVGWHSTARVSYTVAAYSGFGGGCTWYLNGAQVVKLVERSNAAFEPIEPSEADGPF